ncbi:hypothetical protein Q7C18_06720 [Nesterenkonia sp. CL21]|uniref:hypothetical protein n=1 Tax=Nesterenkonia sp. CL21 TaxID=3064894 RepID=UPI002879F820|nr:hypothetical protein [Nesterenkonia sp. CL21]MDS2172383.1 hypothetical protein [Nesterenkonia sp. CL21]
MVYRYALARENYADLSTGRVLYSAPGFPAFPVRLASEIFQRALTLTQGGPVTVWDPCCGSGYLLTVLSFLHRRNITRLLGTDLDPAALTLAQKNLNLLSEHGLEARSVELQERAERLGKPAYVEAAVAAQRLAHSLTEQGGPLPHTTGQADVFDPDQLQLTLGSHRPELVITDVPYGERTSWGGSDKAAGIPGMLRALGSVLENNAVIAVTTRGRKVHVNDGPSPIASFKIGTRAVAFFRAPC